jgi:hypothetical protein
MKNVLISILLLSAGAAFANEAGDEQVNRAAFDGQRTRAEVRAEYLGARTAGTLPVTSEAASLQAPAAPARFARATATPFAPRPSRPPAPG